MASSHARLNLLSHMQQNSKEGPYISPQGPQTGFKSLNWIKGISSWSQGWHGNFPLPSTIYLALHITNKAAKMIRLFILVLYCLFENTKIHIVTSSKNWRNWSIVFLVAFIFKSVIAFIEFLSFGTPNVCIISFYF